VCLECSRDAEGRRFEATFSRSLGLTELEVWQDKLLAVMVIAGSHGDEILQARRFSTYPILRIMDAIKYFDLAQEDLSISLPRSDAGIKRKEKQGFRKGLSAESSRICLICLRDTFAVIISSLADHHLMTPSLKDHKISFPSWFLLSLTDHRSSLLSFTNCQLNSQGT
jgi:hypothetical protein